MITNFLYKSHNFHNRISEVKNETSITTNIPGAHYNKNLSVNNSKAVKTSEDLLSIANNLKR